MFRINEKCEINRNTLKCDYIRSSPSELSTINTANSQIHINIPREDSVVSLLNSYLDLNFDVVNPATNNSCVDGNDIRLVNLGPVALFSNYKLTTSSGKHLEDVIHAHIVSLMYTLLPSGKGSVDLSIGFDHDRGRRRNELTNKKTVKGRYHVRIFLKDIFGFAEHQEKPTCGLGYKLKLTQNTHNSVLNKDNAINIGKIKINVLEWYVAHFTPSI